ncbi:MAG TPA: hypothetical protein VMV89_03785 [Candidatus Paceibacterota bacterium]|nr:hypothetical protein [Candidatus Paceibacterota bacterium]
MQEVLRSIQKILAGEEDQITIRHLFYRLVGLKQIEKTEAAYKSLCGHLSKWRRSGEVSWNAFADNTRWHLGTETFNGLNDALANTVQCYRRNLWAQQSAHVEIWGEKDAISGILFREADTFGVKVFTCRGFASLSALYSAANIFKQAVANGKEVFIYYFGDHDPSGLAIDHAAVKSFRDDFGVEVNLTRAAITPEQIEQHNLPTRPVKKSDTRAANWHGGCVEVDTMPPAVLKKLVRDCITKHIEPHEWEQTQLIEAAERETLRDFAASLGKAA